MVSINPDRLLADLKTLRSFGAYKTGVHRPTFSPEDLAARKWFVERLSEAGFDAKIDGIGSVFGFSRAAGPKLIGGSHLESQNHAGWLDGALGCVYALETARALAESPEAEGCGFDVVAFCDEEGHFGSFLGSRSSLGLLDENEIDASRNRYDGTPLREALKAAGLPGTPRIQLDPSRYKGFLEAHIEQGDTLISTGRRIGVVTAIVGIWQYRITAAGEQNHAGTTSMKRRRDAGAAVVRLLAAIASRFPEICGERTVWTAGRITLDPGAPSIIPGKAEALFQIRDADLVVLERLERELQALVGQANAVGPCKLILETMSQSRPALMSEPLLAAIEAATEEHEPGAAIRMPSGAGHDAQYMARVLPSAMLFVPSIGGISHHWTEDTAEEDIVLGAQVYASSAARLLSSA